MSGRLDKNILVISDLHLGEDLRPTTASVSYLRRLARLERELVSFVTHYTQNRLGGRPWRLVVNGDMVDFMSILILPVAPSTEEERLFGLGSGESQSLTKRDQVMARHPEGFRALAGFVAAGNEMVVVVGNHDVEFHYEVVQRRLVEAMVLLGAVAERIRFCPWFYYEAEVVYVEHGHQYDEYCSFDYQLHPVEARGGLTLSMAHAGVRYFTNRVPTMDPHCAEGWGFVDYIRWLRAQGARGAARLLLFYAGLVRKLIEIWASLTDRSADAIRAETHRTRLHALAASYRIAVEQVEALDGLNRLPVLRSFHKLLITMFLDRLLLGLTVTVGLIVVLSTAHGWWRLGGAIGTLVMGAVVNQLLGRLRLLDSKELLRRAPEAIRKIMRAPFIVFGHSHFAESVMLPGGGRYFNTGAWLGVEGEGRPFTHLIISGDREPEAKLCQWRDGISAPF